VEIFWTKEAEEGLSEIENYLRQNFGNSRTQRFLIQLFQAIEHLAVLPKMYPVSQKRKGIRRMVFKKKTIVLYKEAGVTLYIASVFDHRKGK